MPLKDMISDQKVPFAIYGAQVVAYGAYKAILYLCGRAPQCFVVTSPEGNPQEIEGIPVHTPDMVSKDTLIVVAVTELLQQEILKTLSARGFQKVFVLTQHEEHLLMSAYFDSLGLFPTAQAGSENCDPSSLALYEVRNHRDKPLAAPPLLRPWEISIQAGAALTELRVAELGDDTGVNISHKNRQYCEMSATYWVWKNASHRWKGIEHYRRHLLVTPEMLGEDVDAILPLPYVCHPHTVNQFRRFVSEEVLQALLKTLRELHPEEYGDYHGILYGQYQYTYNLVCAREAVFADYCSWFFRITEHMEAMAEEVPALGNTRALSYVAEVLTNLYFMHNQRGWTLRHVEKAIYT